MENRSLVIPALLLAAGVGFPTLASAQMQISATPIGEGLYVVQTRTAIPTAGSATFNMNNLLLVGLDQVVLVDTLFPPNQVYFPFSAAIHGVTSGRQVTRIINTSWHFDHVGLNAPFRQLEGTAAVLAHWRAGAYLLDPPCGDDLPGIPCTAPFLDPDAQPTQAVSGEARLALDNEEIVVKTVEHAHSGADLFVRLKRANVVYTGDIYFGGAYPIIDRAGGGTVNGTLAALHQVLAQIDEDTIVVPSHGAIGDRQSLVAFTNMLETSRAQVRALIARGLTEDQVMNDPSFAALDEQWAAGFISGPLFRRILYRDLVSPAQR